MNLILGSIAASALFSCGILAVGNYIEIENPTQIKQQINTQSASSEHVYRENRANYIIQADDASLITNKVEEIGGRVIETYPSLNSVDAVLTQSQRDYLHQHTDFVIHTNYLAFN